jgi:hypothetical protein
MPAKKVLSGDGRGIGTPVAEYATSGPYSCQNCHFLKGRNNGKDKIYEDSDGEGRCDERHMKKDPKVKHDSDGLAIVNIEYGCCRFVSPMKD